MIVAFSNFSGVLWTGTTTATGKPKLSVATALYGAFD